MYRSYSLRMRKDLRDIFDQIRATSSNSTCRMSEDVSAQCTATSLFVPKTALEQVLSKLKWTYFIKKKKKQNINLKKINSFG